MDSRLRKRVRNMSTEQEPHNTQENPSLSHLGPRESYTVHTRRNGPHHWTSQEWRIRRHPHYRRPWMLTRSPFPTMHHGDHRRWNSQTILRPPVQMVRTPHAHHQRQRPTIYLTLRQSTHKELRDTAESVHGVSPSNGWPIRKEESMGRTIPPTNRDQPRRMEQVAPTGNSST